jgi:hypothetical protein
MAPRRIASLVWGALVAMLLLFLAVVLALEKEAVQPAGGGLLFWLAVATSALGIVLSRVVPPRIPGSQAGGRPAATALLRFILGWGLCAGVAIFPAVAHMLVHDHRLLGVFAVDALALVLLYPGENAWAHLAAEQARPGHDRAGRQAGA